MLAGRVSFGYRRDAHLPLTLGASEDVLAKTVRVRTYRGIIEYRPVPSVAPTDGKLQRRCGPSRTSRSTGTYGDLGRAECRARLPAGLFEPNSFPRAPRTKANTVARCGERGGPPGTKCVFLECSCFTALPGGKKSRESKLSYFKWNHRNAHRHKKRQAH